MENEYKPKVGELVFTNAGAGRLERGETDKNFVPYYHIWATFLNDKGVKFAVQFAASFKNNKDCSCEWSENITLRYIREKQYDVWFDRYLKIQKAKETMMVGLLKKPAKERERISKWCSKANRLMNKIVVEARKQPYYQWSNIQFKLQEFDGFKMNVYRTYPYCLESLLKIINYFYGCSYTSAKIVEGMGYDVVCKCK